MVQLNDLLAGRSRGCSIILDTLPVAWIGHSIRPPAIERDYSRTLLIFLMPTVGLLSLDDPASIQATTSCRSITNVGFFGQFTADWKLRQHGKELSVTFTPLTLGLRTFVVRFNPLLLEKLVFVHSDLGSLEFSLKF